MPAPIPVTAPHPNCGPRREGGGDSGRKSFGGRDGGAHGAPREAGSREGGFRGGESRGFGGGDRRPAAFGKTSAKPYQPHGDRGERGGDHGFERRPRAPRRDER